MNSIFQPSILTPILQRRKQVKTKIINEELGFELSLAPQSVP